MIKVFGHTSPDTDSTGSPIIWAWYLSEVRKTPAKAVLQGEPNTEAAWMLTRWNLDKPEIILDVEKGEKCVVVDTNNPAELPAGINDADVIEIIDHHMLAGGVKTKTPINITIRPLACTATIMHDLIGDDLARAPEAVKGAMLTCILSDTLEFRSPTTTPHDRAVAEKLAAELGLNITDYANEMFAAKSDVSAFSDEALLRMDSKEYELGGKQLRISVLETTAPQVLLDRKDALVAAMPGVAAADGADHVLLFIIDILREEATLLVPDDFVREVAVKSFGATVTGDTVVLPGIMSRKKQIIPALAV
ncbi:manganese-dependent inorganic pyrophosphatase [Paracoccus sp. R12_1]|uniref:manganese-dependent inorganic pyrophosphatase n=1 Tax=unclassified Paracoccus (in: a-proteobacteria) TaxID=2688777 RepID=UPI001ADD40CF|nr:MULTISPECIES: manganese-dependent inorganic pyrophosphatase [unclassified Paracoccus (in: a-proteobacteria)]MBO9454954.1 manganese-dependent inorganic pyrophosphatase [Paracoccus sp. R12_2]MBO9485358.1 manganese-dependent inorganic pyrophosphatase [Paracoccus sp. R12_1]